MLGVGNPADLHDRDQTDLLSRVTARRVEVAATRRAARGPACRPAPRERERRCWKGQARPGRDEAGLAWMPAGPRCPAAGPAPPAVAERPPRSLLSRCPGRGARHPLPDVEPARGRRTLDSELGAGQ